MLKWRYQLTFTSASSVFSGLAVAGLVDRMIIRQGNGLPYIPGSTVKGRWRFMAERLLAALGNGKDEPYWLHPAEEPGCKLEDLERGEGVCTICRLFGNSSIPARIWVGQAELESPWRDLFRGLLQINQNPVVRPEAEIRPGIAISRTRRTALPDHLFFDETTPADLTFAGEVFYHDSLTDDDRKFLRAAARLVDRLGGRKGVGRGILEGGLVLTQDPAEAEVKV